MQTNKVSDRLAFALKKASDTNVYRLTYTKTVTYKGN